MSDKREGGRFGWTAQEHTATFKKAFEEFNKNKKPPALIDIKNHTITVSKSAFYGSESRQRERLTNLYVAEAYHHYKSTGEFLRFDYFMYEIKVGQLIEKHRELSTYIDNYFKNKK